jgi:dolichol kinase
MNWKVITKWVVGASIVGLIIYDVIAIVQGGKISSISWFIIEHSYDNPIAPFCAGVLCGHLFWRMKDPTIKD